MHAPFRPNQKTKDSYQKQADTYQFPKTMTAGVATVANLYNQTKNKQLGRGMRCTPCKISRPVKIKSNIEVMVHTGL